MYVCMYVCMFYVCIHTRHACMHVCMYVCMYVCTYVRMYLCMYVRMCVRTYACMDACPYACMYVYLNPQTSTNLWQTLLSSCFCSYEHFFVIRALFRKQLQFEQKSTSLGFGCFGVSASCSRALTLRVAGGGAGNRSSCAVRATNACLAPAHVWRILAFWRQFAARNLERNFPQLERNFPQPSAISKSVGGSVVPPPKARKDIQVCENEYALSTHIETRLIGLCEVWCLQHAMALKQGRSLEHLFGLERILPKRALLGETSTFCLERKFVLVWGSRYNYTCICVHSFVKHTCLLAFYTHCRHH